MHVGNRLRLSLLAVTSMATVAGTALATPVWAMTEDPPVASLDLSAAWATADPQGNLSGRDIFDAAEPAMVEGVWSVTPGASSAASIVSTTVDCGVPGQPFLRLPPTPGPGSASVFYCFYSAGGTYTVTLTGTDDQQPAQTTTVVKTVTIVQAAIATSRYDGRSRYGTGVAVSEAGFPAAGSAQAVVLARGDDFADALAGVPLAADKHGPLLLTPGGTSATALDPNVQAEIERVLPRDREHTVFILGGTAAIPQPIEDQLRDVLGYDVVRIAGSNRFATALAVATDPQALDDPADVVVARGDDFADALAAGPFAADPGRSPSGVPAAIVLSDGAGSASSPAVLDTATAAYLESKFTAGSPVTAIGGGAAAAVGKLPGGQGRWTPIVGEDRFRTALSVAWAGWHDRATGAFTTPIVGVATGLAFPDALTGGAFMAEHDGPLLLADPATGEPIGFLRQVGRFLTQVDMFGGPQTLPTTMQEWIASAIDQPPSSYTEYHVDF